MMLWILAAMAYVQVGYQLGKKSAKTWRKGDSKSLESFLLFPASHARGTVGHGSLPFMSGVNDDDDTMFRVIMTLLWPLMLAWNGTLVVGLLGPDKLITRLLKKPPTLEERFAALELEEMKADRKIKRLEAPKRPRASRKKKVHPPPKFAQPPPLESPSPARSESVPPPVQVRVTVDVTAPGHATETAPDHVETEPVAKTDAAERVVH
jgi:hypothetical protein